MVMKAAHKWSFVTALLALACLAVTPFHLYAADAVSWEQQEEFLLKAKIGNIVSSKKGVTGTSEVTLSDGTLTHKASVQAIHDAKTVWLGEVNFKDYHEFNIAGWRLARLLGIGDMVPLSVQRKFKGSNASYTWWVDDVKMDELKMRADKVSAPNQTTWNQELAVVRVFDQLIYNMDRNQTNLLIGSDWRIWMIDHGRAFRAHKTLKDPAMLTQIDRKLLAALKTLDEPTLKKEFKDLVDGTGIRALLERRDLIVKFFEAKGESALYDRPARP
jgi:uncharacterized protein YkvS